MKVATCCGCCSLKKGTIIIGATGIVLSLICLILNFTTDVIHQEPVKTEQLDLKTLKIVYAVSYCVTIGISTLLIIGAVKKNTCLMLPWLIVGILGIVGLCVNVLTVAIVSFTHSLIFHGILWLIFGLLGIVIQTYLWLVVYNYRKELLIEKMNIRMSGYGGSHSYQQVAGQN